MRNTRPEGEDPDIAQKANKVLHLTLIALLLIFLRIWHLAVVQHEEREEAARRPQQRTVWVAAQRGTIRDRFNIPLALNKIQYNAAVSYAQIRQIPSIAWKKEASGKSVKIFKRREYIKALAEKLADILELDPCRLEDLIHAKASLHHQVPYTIKEAITEEQYYRLKMLEKNWLGLQAQRLSCRFYPYGRSACDVIGYLGPIDRKEYEAIVLELHALELYVRELEEGLEPELPDGFATADEVGDRLNQLRLRAYTISDAVGKSGVESRFEEDLRGFFGVTRYYSDARGNFLRQLPGSVAPVAGDRLILSLSIELQQFAEKLLLQNERIRSPNVTDLHSATKAFLTGIREPWMKGGAIVAMDPQTGEVVALASYPRYDPNDFIQVGGDEGKKRRTRRQRWLESPVYLAKIWDQRLPLERERYDDRKQVASDEALTMTWSNYLSLILPADSAIRSVLDSDIKTVQRALELQQSIEQLMELCGVQNVYWIINVLYPADKGHTIQGSAPSLLTGDRIKKALSCQDGALEGVKKKLDKFFSRLPHNYDKIFLVDLCRLAVDSRRTAPSLAPYLGKISLDAHKNHAAALAVLEDAAKAMALEIFYSADFKLWRQDNERSFLQKIRKEEKEKKIYPKPYIDYLDGEQQRQFTEFWQDNRLKLLTLFLLGEIEEAYDSSLQQYIDYFTAWHGELKSGAHTAVEWRPSYLALQAPLTAISLSDAAAYLMTLRSFDELDRQLLGSYRQLRKHDGLSTEKDLAAAFYPLYGFGFGRSQAYRQATTLGSTFKLVTAHEALIQQWNKLDPSRRQNRAALNPLEIIDTVSRQGNKIFLGLDAEGHQIPQMYKGGRMPRSLSRSIGKLDIVRALETSSNPYFALLAGDVLSQPDDLSAAAKKFSFGAPTGIDLPAEIGGRVPDDLKSNRSGLYATAIGQHTLVTTPLQTAVMLAAIANGGKLMKPKLVNFRIGRDSKYLIQEPSIVRWQVPMPEQVRAILLDGLHKTVARSIRQGMGPLNHFYRDYPEAVADYLALQHELIGKTSTAEAVEQLNLDRLTGTNLYNHVWFGGICFPPMPLGKGNTHIFSGEEGTAELIVVVYLRFGAYGKETAPLAAQVAAQWRAIKQRSLRG